MRSKTLSLSPDSFVKISRELIELARSIPAEERSARFPDPAGPSGTGKATDILVQAFSCLIAMKTIVEARNEFSTGRSLPMGALEKEILPLSKNAVLSHDLTFIDGQRGFEIQWHLSGSTETGICRLICQCWSSAIEIALTQKKGKACWRITPHPFIREVLFSSLA